MSKSINDKKVKGGQNKAGVEYNNFLTKHIVEGKDAEYTHTSFGPPWKKYFITDDELDTFYELHSDLIGVKDLFITERPKYVSELLIDIDWHFGPDGKNRQYTSDEIKYVISKTNNILKKYYQLTRKMIKVFTFQKDKPTRIDDKNEYKDGFHLIYPYLPIPKEMRYIILTELHDCIEQEDGFGHINYTNSLNTVVDMCIVNRNGWMLYGSRKHNGHLYKLTQIYNYNLEEEDMSKLSNYDLTALLSNRKYKDTEGLAFKKEVNELEMQQRIENILIEHEDKRKKAKPKNKKTPVKHEIDDDNDADNDNNPDENTEADKIKLNAINKDKEKDKKKRLRSNINIAKKLALILSIKRAESYHTWIRVGWALHNVSDKLLETFKLFSQKAPPSQYDEAQCEKIWEKASDEGLTISSLHLWARQDNPDEYAKILRESINELFEEAETGTEYDIAKIVFELYKHSYRCVSIKNSIWYEFQGHRWVEIESGYTLHTKISEELTKEFAYLNSSLYAESATKEGPERDNLLKRANNITKIILNLKKSGFKGRVLEECARIFYDVEFEEKLDSNKNLIGFNNGVYDLDQGCFREGTPDDYVTFTVGYDYVDYGMEHPYVRCIEEFFRKIQQEEDMREYILTLLSSYLDGHTKQQKFIIWTGSGSNGKSTAIEFFQMAFGDYCGVLPTTVLTRKRGSSSAATPEMAEMKGKRFVVFQEPESDDKIYVGFMKELTGSDYIYARPLFRDPIRFKPQFKLLLTCNKLPFIPSTDGGTWRRLRVAPWESEFVDIDDNGMCGGEPLKENQFPKDYGLTEKLEEWKCAFLWYLINKYYKQYQKADLKIREPEKVLLFTKKYKKASDIYLEFLEDNMTFTEKKKDYETIEVVYAAFKYWHKESYSHNVCPSKKELVEYLTSHEYDIDARYLYGAKFYQDEDPNHSLDE